MPHVHLGKRVVSGAAAVALGLAAAIAGPVVASSAAASTTTPIQHLVVIYQENVSFDHYFGTYPHVLNNGGHPFTSQAHTPAVNGLSTSLLTANPNVSASGSGTVNPRRYDPTNINDVLTCDQDHNYNDEQRAFDNGKMDLFPGTVGNKSSKTPESTATAPATCNANDVMNYYDGNTVTALWNYAQHYSMSDNSFSSTFGPSSPGAINLVSGDTGGVDSAHQANSPTIASAATPNADLTADGSGGYSLTSDAQPYWDDCSTSDAVALTGKNVGDLLNTAGVSWGWFEGGFRPTTPYATAAPGQATSTFTPDQFKGKFSQAPASDQGICNAVHPVGAGLGTPLVPGTGQYGFKDDYIPHHEPFQYYATTANPHHLTVATDGNGNDTLAGLRAVGTDTQHFSSGTPQFDTPNHQYDTSDFNQLLAAIDNGELPASALPAVSFLKAPGYQDGHAAYSDPFDEQQFVVDEINALQTSPAWASTAVVIAYDDSDGWYDHADPGVRNPSVSAADGLTGTGLCGSGAPLAGQQGRCGYGPRQPLLVVSPWAKKNAVDHTKTDQSSITRFIEDNWHLPRITGSFDAIAGTLNNLLALPGAHGSRTRGPNAPLFFLDPVTGEKEATGGR
jgi:phospholipase C